MPRIRFHLIYQIQRTNVLVLPPLPNAYYSHGTNNSNPVTVLLILFNATPVQRYGKRQNTVKTLTYVSELVVVRISAESKMEISYGPIILGVPIDGT